MQSRSAALPAWSALAHTCRRHIQLGHCPSPRPSGKAARRVTCQPSSESLPASVCPPADTRRRVCHGHCRGRPPSSTGVPADEGGAAVSRPPQPAHHALTRCTDRVIHTAASCRAILFTDGRSGRCDAGNAARSAAAFPPLHGRAYMHGAVPTVGCTAGRCAKRGRAAAIPSGSGASDAEPLVRLLQTPAVVQGTWRGRP